MTSPAVVADDITFSYGHLQVLFGANVEVSVGGRVALLGTNGVGKSTLLRIISGLLKPTTGRVKLFGEDVTDAPAHERVRRGLTLVEGGRAIFPSVNVRENLVVGAFPLPRVSAEIGRRIDDALAIFPTLKPRLNQPAGSLSGGEQQMLALARAVVAQPRVLLIDELSLGLAPVVMEEIAAAIEQLAAQGVTLLIVEQSLNVAMALADTSYFLEKGEVRFAGPTTELVERGDLARAVFFGTGAR